MRLKSFHANTMAEAMRLVRDTLGDDAIIVASREEDGGGVRLTAAIEELETADPIDVGHDDDTGGNNGGGRNGAPVGGTRGVEPARGPRFGQPRRAAPPPQREVVDVADLVGDALHKTGTPPALAEKLVDAICGLDVDDPVLALGTALDSLFAFKPLPCGPTSRPLMLVGPPGAGKTLTVAKLAARAVFNKLPVGVITTDTVRAGGVEQLSAFTRLMKLDLLTVEDTAALADALTVHRDVDQVLIDSAGCNPFDRVDVADLRRTLGSLDIEPVLVLPAGIDTGEAAEIGAIFRGVGVRRAVVTRLDMTRRLGAMLGALYEARLDFCDVGTAARVADGLTPLDPIALARLLTPTEGRPAARSPRHTGTHA